MTYYAFELLLGENMSTFWLALLCSVLLLWWIFFYSRHLFDPLLTQMVFSVLANTVPFFLYFMDEISDHFFWFFLRCELWFWICFGCGKVIERFLPAVIGGRPLTLTAQEEIEELNRKTFYALLFTYIGIQLFAYYQVGIPIFHEGGRLGTFTDSGGGWGILERLNLVNNVVCLIFGLHFWANKNERFSAVLCFICFFAFTLLSGGKAYMLIFLYGIFCYNIVYLGKPFKLDKRIIWGSVLLALGCILAFRLQTGNESMEELFTMLVNRITCFGDCFFLAFPGEHIEEIELPGSFIFQEPLAAFRLIPRDNLIPAIGFQLDWLVHPWKYGESSGPNTRAPVLAYIICHSEWFCALLGVISGMIFFALRKVLFAFKSKNIFWLAILSFAFYSASIAVTDFILFVTEITNLIFYLAFYSPLLLFYEISYRKITAK